jgi:two-component system, LytTR family, sensor kinase
MVNDTSSWRGLRRKAVLGFAVFTLLGLFSFTEMYVGPFAKERSLAWQEDLLLELCFWYMLLPGSLVVYWLAQRYPVDRPRLGSRLAIHSIGGTTFALVSVGIVTAYSIFSPAGATFYRSPAPFLDKYFRRLNSNLHFYLVIYLAIAGGAHAVQYYQRLRERERQTAALRLETLQLQTQLAQAQLQALKMQIHPHFLFNTLHSITALVREGDRKAAIGMIVGLGDLLRMTLEGSGEQDVPLRKELEFVRKYLDIEQVRFQDRLVTNIDADPSTLDAEVPYLILQPLVENAIRHGVAKRSGAALLQVKARRESGNLILLVCDDGPGLPEAPVFKPEGLGTKNVRSRLRQRYGEHQTFELRNAEGGGAVASITIPLAASRAAGYPERT